MYKLFPHPNFSMVKEKSVGAVLFREEGSALKFLLLHYKAGHWGFPKGHVENGETEEQTLRREIREETGIANVNVFTGFREHTKYFFRRGNETVFKEVVFYLASCEAKEVKISHEHQGFEWLSSEEALSRLTFDNTKFVLKNALAFFSGQ